MVSTYHSACQCIPMWTGLSERLVQHAQACWQHFPVKSRGAVRHFLDSVNIVLYFGLVQTVTTSWFRLPELSDCLCILVCFFPLVQTTVHQDFLLHKEFARSSGTCNSTVMEGMIQRVEILTSRFNISSSAGTFVLSEIYDDTWCKASSGLLDFQEPVNTDNHAHI